MTAPDHPRPPRRTARTLAALCALALAASGCAPTGQPAGFVLGHASVLDLHDVRPGGRLAPGDRERLLRFLLGVGRGRADTLSITLVCGPRREREADILALLASLGAKPSRARLKAGPGPGCTRVEAAHFGPPHPVCPALFTQSHAFPETADPALGCATRVNLAEMANDPLDVLGRPGSAPSDGERAAIPVARYRTFTTPALPSNAGGSPFLGGGPTAQAPR